MASWICAMPDSCPCVVTPMSAIRLAALVDDVLRSRRLYQTLFILPYAVAPVVAAALQSIPRSLVEAAAIDGAGPVRRFFNLVYVWHHGAGSNNAPFGKMLFNSAVMALAITFGKITVSILSAYAIVYFRFPCRSLFFWMIFLTLMLPVEVRIFPTVEVIAHLNMTDSMTGLTLPLMASATATFLFRQFFMTLPDELMEPKDRGIAMVFQNYALYPHMSVYDNMAYGLKIRGFGKAQIRERVEDAARILELLPLLQCKPRVLSGGQRQRVAMGRAIVREPAVFLFDEPLSNLDAKLRVQMRLELQQLHQRLRTTSLYVTHDQVEAMTLAERVIVINKGIAEQIGPPTEIYRRPASLFVASFIGSPAMNLWAGRISDDGTQFMFSAEFVLPLPVAKPAWGGRALTLGVRPEHIQLTTREAGGTAIADHP